MCPASASFCQPPASSGRSACAIAQRGACWAWAAYTRFPPELTCWHGDCGAGVSRGRPHTRQPRPRERLACGLSCAEVVPEAGGASPSGGSTAAAADAAAGAGEDGESAAASALRKPCSCSHQLLMVCGPVCWCKQAFYSPWCKCTLTGLWPRLQGLPRGDPQATKALLRKASCGSLRTPDSTARGRSAFLAQAVAKPSLLPAVTRCPTCKLPPDVSAHRWNSHLPRCHLQVFSSA